MTTKQGEPMGCYTPSGEDLHKWDKAGKGNGPCARCGEILSNGYWRSVRRVIVDPKAEQQQQ